MALVTECMRHPGVETALRCQACETPICPKCLIHSPVGAKCKDCARVMRSPIYTLKPLLLLRTAGAALLGGIVMGFAWGLILVPFQFGFLSIFLGVGRGYAFTRLLEMASGRKRGPVMIGLAVMGIAVAWAITVPMVSWELARFGLIAAAVGVYFSYQNLR